MILKICLLCNYMICNNSLNQPVLPQYHAKMFLRSNWIGYKSVAMSCKCENYSKYSACIHTTVCFFSQHSIRDCMGIVMLSSYFFTQVLIVVCTVKLTHSSAFFASLFGCPVSQIVVYVSCKKCWRLLIIAAHKQ